MSVTCSGIPDDCIYIGTVDVNKEFHLNDLKESVLSMEYFQGRDVVNECIRIREKLSNMFFGKIYKDNQGTRSLK